MGEYEQINITANKGDAAAYAELLKDESVAGGSAATLFSRMLATVARAGRHADVDLRAELLEDGSVRVYGINCAKAAPRTQEPVKPVVDEMARVAAIIQPVMKKIGVVRAQRGSSRLWYCYRDFSMQYGNGVRSITNEMLRAGVLLPDKHGNNRCKKHGVNSLGNVLSDEYVRRFVDKSWIRSTY